MPCSCALDHGRCSLRSWVFQLRRRSNRRTLPSSAVLGSVQPRAGQPKPVSISDGGLGAAVLVTEMLVAAVAAELLLLLNGHEQASTVARDTLRQALSSDPDSLDRRSGLVTNAMFFLPGYGLYLTVGRILDNLRPPSPQSPSRAPQQPVSAVWDCLQTPSGFPGRLFLLPGPPPLSPQAWQAVLPDCCPVSAAAAALLQDGVDWSPECRLFCQQLPNPNLRRTGWTDLGRTPQRSHFYQPGPGLWHCNFPGRFGWERSSIHYAELLSLVVAMRWRSAGSWNLLAFDRSSLFDVLSNVDTDNIQNFLSATCLPPVFHLRTMLRQLKQAWLTGAAGPKPVWRIHQEFVPQAWNVVLPVDGRPKQFSRVSFVSHGLVGVHVKSHQASSAHPHLSITQGNAVQDQGCRDARSLPRTPDIRYPSGGPWAFFFCVSRASDHFPHPPLCA